LRTSNGKLFNGDISGWFADLTTGLTVTGLTNATLTKGAFRGTYLLTI